MTTQKGHQEKYFNPLNPAWMVDDLTILLFAGGSRSCTGKADGSCWNRPRFGREYCKECERRA